jgi:hypothetical protein
MNITMTVNFGTHDDAERARRQVEDHNAGATSVDKEVTRVPRHGWSFTVRTDDIDALQGLLEELR